ncbi:AAA family ATPase [Clostridium paraputrificum]|jgi:lon-related putative ATP-dependent protease|uniref:endopeptidase La n=1 Tax=Clostridium paraputrificum TaxID=29363 RepID=A0A174RXH4_9CLOT|nr:MULTISPECIES: AAA family ATPase [Clostridium]MDB2071236.1 AAA family ATPase [Clostridium paraputrificum]MDB2080765.1 AAA family ATPase [Clostridium paraputrificum]MDB2088662.1 AAA family ATPase [Clostridium paraputrificum]MDB2095103.1 AAA family ATPase [Clostridium paraputrificum]MDB2101521.1 AAA family ATPase [Clostridium paraputrificum]
MKRELTPNEVLFNVDLNEDDDNKIRLKDIPEITSAYEKIKRAISIDEEGYNLYIIDSFSKDKLENLTKFIENLYKSAEAPRDICYATINDPKRPEPIFLTNGKGAKLKETIENIKNSYYEVAMEFYNTSSESEKDRIIDEVHSKRTNYIGELMEMAKIDGFDVKATNGGFAFIPLKEGEAMTEKEYDELSEESKDSIVLKASNLKKKAEVVLEKLKDIELTSMKKLKGIYAEFMDVEMEDEKEDCLLNFIDDDDAYEYLEKVFYSIEKELVDCYTMNVEDDESDINEVLDKYDISVLVDNTNNKNPRVIYEEDPNVTNLFGNIEYENHNGLYSTDLSLINSGSMLQANEGCIIIRLNQLAMNNYSYYYLKKTLMSGKVSIDSSRGYLDIISINGVKPKAVPINVKVILIGDYESYDILYNADEDFKSLFPIRVEFSNYVKNQPIKGKVLKDYILERGKKHYINKVSDDAIKEIIKYLSRVAECRGKICIEDKNIDRLLILANNMAELDGREIISDKDIRNVAYEKSLIEDEILEMYEDSKIILTLSGEKVGAINGLAVLSSGYYTFGKPMRLTCVACKGEGKILDIQKESNMSGSIHEKSINILSGLLSNLIIPYEKLPVDFHLSFEQTYGQIDGDSASVAEILCILSALSKVGIKQNIAVTGSINQFGEVQAIGGVNEKIEGFYKVCKLLGDSKDKGVLIPITNSEDLVLNKEVEEAIEKGEFHIYTMENLQDAIEVMMLDSKTSYKDLFKIIEKEVEKYKGKSK